jgi:signal transduction histidine kinase
MCALGVCSISFLYQIEIRHEKIRQEYVERDRLLEKLRANIYVSGTYFRDFLLDTSDAGAARHRDQFLSVKAEILAGAAEYARIAGLAGRRPTQELQGELNAYFDTLTPALTWSAKQRQARANDMIQHELLPRRMMAVSLADRVQQSSEKRLEINSEAVGEMFSSFRTRLLLLLVLTIAIGVALAAVTMWRLLHLERISEARFLEVAGAREELKQLSAELLSAQESERRRISRELHDEVGQVLSAMMLAAGNLRSSLNQHDDGTALRQLQLIEDMTERSARVVRNLSLILRPTMLDDLGLIAALKWLAREVSRTGSLQVEVDAEEAPDELPEEHRTCVYRVVQEAVRNASRHSGAHHVRITAKVEIERTRLYVGVQDDGKGFNPALEKGMGILGMEERVAHLGGAMQIATGSGRGTKVNVELPLPESMRKASQETNPLRTA